MLQVVGPGPGYLCGVAIAAEIKRSFDDHAFGVSGDREPQFNRTNSGHDDLDSEHRRVGHREGTVIEYASLISSHSSVFTTMPMPERRFMRG